MSEKFVEAIENGAIKERGIKFTENGALSYASTGSALLDLNFAVTRLRYASNKEILNMFKAAYAENHELAVKWAFFARDIREGLGERKIFKVILKYLANEYPYETRKFVHPSIIPEYGTWKDVLDLFGTKCEEQMFFICHSQIVQDQMNLLHGNRISLLAKWMPSINTSSSASRALAEKFIKRFLITEEEYRKLLKSLREYIGITEGLMSANKWDEIDYSKVPSVANLKYSDAFLKHDPERRKEYINDVKRGKKKINSSILYPHQIISELITLTGEHGYDWMFLNSMVHSKYLIDYDISIARVPNDSFDSIMTDELTTKVETMEAMWHNLPDMLPEDADILVVRDGSASMFTKLSPNAPSPYAVCTALTMYIAEHAKGVFHNRFITFSAEPKWVTIPEKITVINKDNTKYKTDATLLDKLAWLYKYDDYSNTNIQKVFELILNTAIGNNLTQDDLPKRILIMSDMEFDPHTFECNNFVFTYIDKLYRDNGYELPKIIFWNICSRTESIPMVESENGVTLVSGFSPNIMKDVLSDRTGPYDILVDRLMSDRYRAIEWNI